ncbi:MAG: 39S ribosomal protein L45 [Desulfovibrio sp.]|nr:39S ribosomal protein L45 [Desulfovibrio sp.]
MPKLTAGLVLPFSPGLFAFPGIARAEAGLPGAGDFLEGSFLGSLLAGYPFTGIGTADIAALALAALLLLRLARRRGDDGSDRTRERFSLPDTRRNPPRNGEDDERYEAAPDEEGEGDEGDEGQGSSGASRGGGNVWTRRLGKDAENGNAAGRENPRAPWRRAERPGRTAREQAEAMWGHLSSRPGADGAPGKEEAALSEDALAPGLAMPENFDAADFLEGARTLYIRLQKAWAARDISGLKPFVAPELMEILQKQADMNPKPGSVDILMINARLSDVLEEGEDQKAVVLFKVLMTTGDGAEPVETAETWTFARGPASDGMWRLQGIGGA